MTPHYYGSYLGPDELQRWHLLGEGLLQPLFGTFGRVAEFGCGSGSFLQRLAAAYGVAGVGFDISERNLAVCRAKGLDARALDFAADDWRLVEQFDVALSFEVVEHLVDPRLYVRNIRHSLMPGGHLLITTPNAFNIRRRLDYLRGRHTDPLTDPANSDFPEHLRLFSHESLIRLMRSEGFTVVAECGDRVPDGQLPGLAFLRSLLSSNICLLLRAEDGQP